MAKHAAGTATSLGRLRARKFSPDGSFWGGVLLLVIWGSAVTVIVSSIVSGASSP